MLKGSIYLIISRILFIISGYVIHVFAARHFSIAEYGYLGIILSLMAMTRVLFGSGLPQSVSKHIAQNIEQTREILKSGVLIMMLFSLPVAIIYFFLSGSIASFLRVESLKKLIQLSAIMMPAIAVFRVYLYALNGQKHFGRQAFILSCYAVGRVVFSLLFVIVGLKIGGIILGFFTSVVVALIISISFNPSIKNVKYFPKKELINYAIPILLSAIGLVIILNVDVLYVKNIIADPEFAGYYVPATVLAKIPYMLFVTFSITFLPTIANSDVSNNRSLKSIIEIGMRQLVILLLPVIILLSGFSEQVISIIYESRYLPAAQPLKILTFGLGFLVIFASIISIFNAIKPKIPITISFFGVLLQLVLCYIFIPKFGVLGAAISTSITSFVLMLIGIIALEKYFNSFMKVSSILRIIFVSSIIFLIVLILNSFHLNKYYIFLFSPLIIIIYFGLLYLIGEIKKKEIENITNIFNLRRKQNEI